MAKSARASVFEGMEQLPEALAPFVEKRLESTLDGYWQVQVVERVNGLHPDNGAITWDQAALLKTMVAFWKESFSQVLGRTERSLVSELQDVRNKLSHNGDFSYDNAERALDSMRRLMEAISAGEAAEKLGNMRNAILRTKFSELARNEERKKTHDVGISTETTGGLLPWRQVVEPHKDVASGDFQQSEFAADLAKVYNGSAPDEYKNPREFFSRTYLTDGLSNLLISAAKRLSGKGGDPVVELQTNFGGGKTHSMLALYHMAGDVLVQDLPGLDQLLARNGLDIPKGVHRAVLVGTSTGPMDVKKREKIYGRKINTTWGELAFQLGGEDAFQMIAEQDEKGIAPGSNLLEEIFRKCAPNLILIDEWVAYLRQIYKVEGLPSGSFDANLSFVQALTEAVKASPQTLLVASLPASQIEVGGEGGQEALARLKQTFSRVESSWRPASQEESYEIVRRRLFREVPSDKYMHRDNTLKQFTKLYHENQDDFPLDCSSEDYRRKMEKAYPIHPDLFDHLYTAWGSLEKFQRTRGVLRLMAQVIHELWMSDDPSVMIMPGSVAIISERVEPELLHYLDDTWQSIIAKDVDGGESTPYQIDKSAPNLGRYSAARRVARTLFMGTAPLEDNKGLDDKQINLGVVQPGEKITTFGDALRRLTNKAQFLHGDLGRYWYSSSPSLNRAASDRANQLEEALIVSEVDKALNTYINSLSRSDFSAVQVATSSADVPDEAGGVRMVVLSVAHPHTCRDGSDAMLEIKDILMNRGSTPRVYRNCLVFLAADNRRLDDLKLAMRASLAWSGIVQDADRLDLKSSELALAKNKAEEARKTVQTRLKEAWCYLVYPYQASAEEDVEYHSSKIPSQDGVLQHACKKLVEEEALFTEIGTVRLNRVLEKYLWESRNHILLRDIWEYLNRYIYFPRFRGRDTLIQSVSSAISDFVAGPFAYAEDWDEAKGQYLGLSIEKSARKLVTIDSTALVVKHDIAEAHRPAPAAIPTSTGETAPTITTPVPKEPSAPVIPGEADGASDAPRLPTRFSGTVMLSADRPARDMHRIVEGIIEQLSSIPGADLSIKLEIDADVSSGLDKAKVRTLIENATTLNFIDKSVR